MNIYGKSENDKKAESIQQCREIVSEIVNLNPTQEQLLVLIQLLACELERHEQMVDITQVVRRYLNSSCALLVPSEEI